MKLLDEAEKTGSTLSNKYIWAKALEFASEMKIANFNASKEWLPKLLSRQNRKQGRTVDHLQKRKPFIRLSFGEKHVIANFIKDNPNKSYPEYAKNFSELWERNVTARQIINTKENMAKWLNVAYKDCQQTHYKFVDEGSDHNGPMVMKRKRSRVMLTPKEREEISNFLADNRNELQFMSQSARVLLFGGRELWQSKTGTKPNRAIWVRNPWFALFE